MLSTRGRRLVENPPLAEYIREHFARADSDEYVPLCIAENKLVADLLLPELGRERALPASVLGYDHMTGALEFREKIAEFFHQRVLGRRFEPEQIAVLAGAGSVLELLFHVIADPGDGVLVPTPSYAGFWPDLETRDELRIVPAHTSSAGGFELTTDVLDRAIESAACPVKALLFTSPDNPSGRVYSAARIEEIIRWADARRIHLVMDEIYALSVFGDHPFVSVATAIPSLGERVHIVWAFSKDFGASGLRTGVLVSENRELHAAIDQLAYWACSSGHTQYVLGEMIADTDWVDRYVSTMQARLRTAYREVTRALDEHGLAHLPSGAGFFLLLDLREYLEASSWEAERALWRRIVEQTNVTLTPGAACRIGEPGFMRLCFAAAPTDAAVAAVHRLGRLLARP